MIINHSSIYCDISLLQLFYWYSKELTILLNGGEIINCVIQTRHKWHTTCLLYLQCLLSVGGALGKLGTPLKRGGVI